MLNEDYLITSKDKAKAIAEWDSPNVNDVSWLFVNGLRQYGPILNSLINRLASFLFKNDINRALDIHDFDSLGPKVSSIHELENARPILSWSSTPEAVRYRIHHTPFGGSEVLVYDESAPLSKKFFEVSSPIQLVEGWHEFRIESVDVFGNESTSDSFPYRTFLLPETVSDLTIVNGSASGLFDITIS